MGTRIFYATNHWKDSGLFKDVDYPKVSSLEFDPAQIDVYENIEQIPDIEASLEIVNKCNKVEIVKTNTP